MIRLRFLIAALATFIGFQGAIASAQTPEVMLPPAISELAGIQSGIGRTWSLDYEAIMANSTPGSVDLNNWQGVTALTAQILQFDTPDNAAGAFAQFSSSMSSGLTNLGQEGTPTISTEDLPDVGDQTVSSTLVNVTEIGETWVRSIAVLDERVVVLVTSLAGSSDSAASADALATYVVNEGEVSPDPVSFDPAGLSRGGLWGILPPLGNPVLDGLIVIRDDQLYPLPRVDA